MKLEWKKRQYLTIVQITHRATLQSLSSIFTYFGLGHIMGHSQMVFDIERGRVLEGRTKAARVPFTTMGFQVVNQCRNMFGLLLAVKTAEIH